MTLGLGHLDASDTLGRIVPAHGRHGGPHQPANGLKPTALRRWLLDCSEHLHNVLAPKKRDTLFAVLHTKTLNNSMARLLCFICECMPLT